MRFALSSLIAAALSIVGGCSPLAQVTSEPEASGEDASLNASDTLGFRTEQRMGRSTSWVRLDPKGRQFSVDEVNANSFELPIKRILEFRDSTTTGPGFVPMTLVQLSETESVVLGTDMDTREGVAVRVAYPIGSPPSIVGLLYRGDAFTLPRDADLMRLRDSIVILAPLEESLLELGLGSTYLLSLHRHPSLSSTRYVDSWRLGVRGEGFYGTKIRATQFPTGDVRPRIRGQGEAVVTLVDRDDDGLFESISH